MTPGAWSASPAVRARRPGRAAADPQRSGRSGDDDYHNDDDYDDDDDDDAQDVRQDAALARPAVLGPHRVLLHGHHPQVEDHLKSLSCPCSKLKQFLSSSG